MIFTTWLGTGYGHIDENGVLVDSEIEYGSVIDDWHEPEKESEVSNPHPHNVQPYTADDLNARIAEQSVDLNRLAATVAGMLATVSALADWANQQIAAAGSPPSTDDSGKRRK